MAEQPDVQQLFQALIGAGANIKDVLSGLALSHPSLKQKQPTATQAGLPPGPDATGDATGGMSPDRMELLRALVQRALAARQAQVGQTGGPQPPAPAPPVVGRNVSPIIPRVTGMEQPLILR